MRLQVLTVWGMVMLITRVDKDSNDSLTYVVCARITGVNKVITVNRLCFKKTGEESWKMEGTIFLFTHNKNCSLKLTKWFCD